MQLLNNEVNMNGNVVIFVTEKSKIVDTTKKHADRLVDVIGIVRGNGKSVSGVNDLMEATERERNAALVLVRKKEEDKRAGFVMIGSVTILGIMLLVGTIFLAIKYFVLK